MLCCILDGYCQQIGHRLFNPLCCWYTLSPAVLQIAVVLLPHCLEEQMCFKLYLMQLGLCATV